MSILGWILAIVGGTGWVLSFFNLIPAFSEIPVPPYIWLAAGVTGLGLLFFTRRPGD